MAYHLTLQSSQDKLNTEDHEQDTHEKQGLIVNRFMNEEEATHHHEDIHCYAQ